MTMSPARRAALVAVLLTAAGRPASGAMPQADAAAHGPAAARTSEVARGTVAFVANVGQADPWARFVAPGRDTSVLFGPGGLSFRLSRRGSASSSCPHVPERGLCVAEWRAGAPPPPLAPLPAGATAGDAERGLVHSVAVDFVGADAEPSPELRASTTVSYLRGRPSDWLLDVPTYARVVYRDVWPGIDVAYDGGDRELKQTIVLAPGADPAAVRLAVRGATSVRVEDGELVVETPAGTLRDAPPVAWQLRGRRRTVVPVAYRLDGPTADRSGTTAAGRPGGPDASTYGFDLGPYDRSAPLYVDPAIVVWSGLYGATGYDRGLAVALAPDGRAVFAGSTGDAAFVAWAGADGRTVEKVVLLDGDGREGVFDLDVDASGAAYVTGPTSSTESTFPVVGGPDLTFNGGFVDGFVARLAPGGAGIDYAGFLGGSGTDFGEGIAVAADGHVILSGLAESSERTFPVKEGPDVTHNGGWDAYLLKLRPRPTSTAVLDNYAWAGFVGGDGDDVTAADGWLSAGHVAVDRHGDVYMSGRTTSGEDTFPDGDGFGDLPGPDRTYNGGRWDAYVVKVGNAGDLVYAGYVGGAGDDDGKGMAVDDRGAAYLTGNTSSDERTFPVGVGPDLTHDRWADAFVAKVRPDGTGLELCGFVGGDDDDSGQAVEIGPDGSIYVAGYSESAEDTFPTVAGPDLTFNGPQPSDPSRFEADAFVGRLAARVDHPDPRSNWDFLGYLGGDGPDAAFWLDVDDAGRAFVVGDTESATGTFPGGDDPAAVPGWDRTYGGSGDAFLVRVDWAPPPEAGTQAFLPWVGRARKLEEGPAPPTVRPGTPRATHEPTMTPAPVPTRGATPAITPPVGEEIAWFDDFSDAASGWLTSDAETDRQLYVDGEFELSTTNRSWFVVQHAPGARVADGAVEVTTRLLEDDDTLTGLIFGPQEGPFLFLVDSLGGFRVAQTVGTRFDLLAESAVTDHVAKGTRPNRLRIERHGPRVRFMANGGLLASLESAALSEPGRVGLLIGTGRQAPGGARFDDLLVTRWGAGRPSPTAPATAPATTPTTAASVRRR